MACSSIEHLCTVLERTPTHSELQHYGSPMYNQRQQIQVRGLKARVVRTADNPSLQMIEANVDLQREFVPVIRTFIDSGITTSQHQFITRQQAKDMKVMILPPIYVFGHKRAPSNRPTFRLTPHGGRDNTKFIPYSTYSTGIDSAGLRYFLALVAFWNLEMFTSDAKNAFPSMNDINSPHVKNKRLIGWTSNRSTARRRIAPINTSNPNQTRCWIQ